MARGGALRSLHADTVAGWRPRARDDAAERCDAAEWGAQEASASAVTSEELKRAHEAAEAAEARALVAEAAASEASEARAEAGGGQGA